MSSCGEELYTRKAHKPGISCNRKWGTLLLEGAKTRTWGAGLALPGFLLLVVWREVFRAPENIKSARSQPALKSRHQNYIQSARTNLRNNRNKSFHSRLLISEWKENAARKTWGLNPLSGLFRSGSRDHSFR